MINPFPDTCFEILKSRVLHHAKLDITVFDTEVLEKLIVEKTGHEMSLHAFNKAFGIIPARFKPSSYTLDVLAVYCDFLNWDDFCIMNE